MHIMKCTWTNCTNEASVPQLSKDGTQWANLCPEHNNELDESMTNPDVRIMLRCYIQAQGGPSKAAERMLS